MGGFPSRAKRVAFGPPFQDLFPVRNPKTEPGAAMMELLAWQVGGMGQVVPRIALTCTVAGGAVSAPVYYGLAFDPNSRLTPIGITYNRPGHYSFAFNQNYEDEKGVSTALSLATGIVMPVSRSRDSGTHTGTHDSPTLVDVSKHWTVNEWVGHLLYNLTDGSFGVVTSNTDSSIAATLAGGAENLWDPDDQYVIVSRACRGWVHLNDNGYSGEIFMSLPDETLADCAVFLLMLW